VMINILRRDGCVQFLLTVIISGGYCRYLGNVSCSKCNPYVRVLARHRIWSADSQSQSFSSVYELTRGLLIREVLLVISSGFPSSERSLAGDMLVSGLKEKGTCSFIPLHSLACLHFGLLRHNHSYRSKPPYSYHHVYRCAS
jgi:hypothetical protein